MNANEYKCQACGGVFEKGWSDEEAATELSETFPAFAPSDCGLVCDDCWQMYFAPPASVGRNAKRQDAEERLGPKDEHAVGEAETPKGGA